MKKRLKRMAALMLAATLSLSAITVQASDVSGDVVESTTTDGTSAASTDTSSATTDTTTTTTTSTETSSSQKPYLALGADLTAEQQSTVLALLGVDATQLANYDVVYVTNEQEHQYLDSYLDSSEIGSKSLSSVVVYEAEEGSGLQITTHNINYCTQGMYENACATAGITDAKIVIAGPTSISGTAALVGIFKAYSEMTGEEISEDVIDGALNELIVTGNLEETLSGFNAEDIEGLIAYAKQYMAEHNLTDAESIGKAVDEACEEYGVTLTDDERSKVIDLLEKLNTLNLDSGALAAAISGVEKASGVLSSVGNFFVSVGSAISGFFKGLFGK